MHGLDVYILLEMHLLGLSLAHAKHRFLLSWGFYVIKAQGMAGASLFCGNLVWLSLMYFINVLNKFALSYLK